MAKVLGKEVSVMGYGVSVVIFCLGVIMDAMIVFYIVNGNRKYKNVDPFADES